MRAASALLLAASAGVLAPSVARAEEKVRAARLEGVVKERGTRRALVAQLLVVPLVGGGEPILVETDAEGHFSVEVPAGKVRVVVSASGHGKLTVEETLAPATALAVDYRLEADRYSRYESVVRGDLARQEITRTAIAAEEIAKVPGTHGDALRAVTNFPGIARAPLDAGQLVIWGSAAGDSSVFVGGQVVPQLFHFGGLTSTFNSELLESIDYLPGNFGVRYGRATGGIIDVTPRAGARDGYHGYAKIDFIDAGLLLEGPIGKGSFAVAARRSTVDAVLNVAGDVIPGLRFTTAPAYWDYQAMFDYPLLGGKLKLMVFGSDDTVALVLPSAPDSDPTLKGRFTNHNWFHTFNTYFTRRFGAVTLDLATSLGPQHSDLGFGADIGYSLDVFEFDLRAELRWKVNPHLRVLAGIDILADHYTLRIRAPYFATEEKQQPPLATLALKNVQAGAWEASPAAYVEGQILLLGERLLLVPGLRVDAPSGTGRVTADPRFTARLTLAPGTSIFGGIGWFHQPPSGAYSNSVLGNPRLRPLEALQMSIGVETAPFRRMPKLKGKVTFFYKQMAHLPVSSDGLVQRDGKVVPEIYSDDGIGRVFGMELLIRQDLSKYLFGWIAYTLIKSERQDHPGDPWRPFQWDQTHILAVVLSVHLPWNVDIGTRFRYVTGNPDTPINGGIFLADYDLYIGLPGARFSTRQADFIQLDARIDKKFVFRSWTLSVYVDVTNVTNRANVEGYAWAYDYSKRVTVSGIPILPSLGVKGAF